MKQKLLILFKLLRSRSAALFMILLILIFSVIIVLLSNNNRDFNIDLLQSPLLIFFFIFFVLSTLSCIIFRGIQKPLTKKRIGSALFHLSMLLILTGALINYLSNISTFLIVTEGQTVNCQNEFFKPGISKFFPVKDFKHLNFYFKKINLEYEKGAVIHVNADVSIKDHKIKQIKGKNISVNHPFFYKKTKFLLSSFGFSPLYIIKDKNDVIFRSFVNLKLLADEIKASDKFYLNEEIIETEFYPDYYDSGGRNFSQSMQLQNPLFFIRLRSKENGELIQETRLRLNETVKIGQYFITIPEIRYWIRLFVITEYGVLLIFIAFLIGTIGLIIRYIPEFEINFNRLLN